MKRTNFSNKKVHKKVNQRGNIVLSLVSTFGIALVLGILFLAIGSQTYSTADPWEDLCDHPGCSDGNNSIGTDINTAVEGYFNAQTTVAEQIPLFALIAIVGAFMTLFAVYIQRTSGGAYGGGGALM